MTPKQTILIRPSNLEQMRDPLSEEWNLPPPHPDEDEHELAGLLDFAQLGGIFESFLAVLGLPVAILDLQGRVLASSKWQRVCLDFHRANPLTLARCIESDTQLANELLTGKPFVLYRCRNGLSDCATRIVLEGRHIANLFIGQFFLTTPDLAYFERQQQEFLFDKTSYFQAIAEVPIVAEEKLPDILKLMASFANQIVALSMARKAALAAQQSVEKQVEERTRELEVVVQQLKVSEQKLAMLYQEAPVGLALNRLSDGQFVEGNPAMYQITGHDPQNITHLSYWDMTPEEYTKAEAQQLSELQTVGRYGPYEKEYIHKDGHRVNVLLHGVRLDLPNDEHLIFSVVQDITARKEAEQQIRRLAYYDALTQLPNRRLLDDRLQQAMVTSHRSGRYCALLFLDLDNFKPLNDQHGHDVGDLLLVEVARRLERSTRKMDTVARFGGDEFIVMIRELNIDRYISSQHAGIVAEKVRNALAEPYFLHLPQGDGNEMIVEHHCTASIGLVMFADHQSSHEDIMKWADIAMYQAKEKGGNTFHFYEPAQLLKQMR